jgi:hypothetical protein
MNIFMDIQPSLISKGSQTVSTLLVGRKRSDRLLFIIILIGTLCLVPTLVIGGAKFGFSLGPAILGVLVIIALIVRWPTFGFFIVVGCALVIDQAPLAVLGNSPQIYIFYWPPSLEGLPDRPIGFLMLLILLVLIIHGLLKRQKPLQLGELFPPYLSLLLCVGWGIVHGLTSGGNAKIMVNEVRSFWYLFLGYLLAYNLIRSKKHLRYFFWFVIIGAGIKALEGTYIYAIVIHGDLADHHEIMSHEESYFWISIILLTMLFSLHHKYRPQFYTAMALLPFLGIALVANNRRADFVAILIGLLIAWVLIFVVKPEARRLLIIVLTITGLLGGTYVAAFSNGHGGISEPARAVVSVFRPDPSEAASNAYRDIENYDLKYTVKQNPLGLGFGKPFPQPILLPNILVDDPVYNYIPHNTIYWVWMRLGPMGYLALWYLFGTIIVRGCIYVRQLKDKYLQLIAIYIVTMAIMEIIVAYADYQLSFYRNVIYVGMLAGILMKLTTLDTKEEKLSHEATRTHA